MPFRVSTLGGLAITTTNIFCVVFIIYFLLFGLDLVIQLRLISFIRKRSMTMVLMLKGFIGLDVKDFIDMNV